MTARFQSLNQWLTWQEQLHPTSIDLGLERIARVADRLHCRSPAKTVITVGGTNGKGSCVALLESILSRAGYRVGSYTSPHLYRYNERLHLCGEEVNDEDWCTAFARVDQARADDSLTYFEFGTLAALERMTHAALDVAILEVGLGGRLDAVNIIDADAALISSIGIDHTDWLGTDRESIGREKAGIFRAGRAAVCGDSKPPASLQQHAVARQAKWRALGAEFNIHNAGHSWHWQGLQSEQRDLPFPALSGSHQLANAASVLMVLEELNNIVPVTRKAIEDGLRWLKLPGRIERHQGRVEQILDVSHNAESALALVDALRNTPVAGRTRAVIGMLQGKDVKAYVMALEDTIDDWYPTGLECERALDVQTLTAHIKAATSVNECVISPSMTEAVQRLTEQAQTGDRILVCGSFYTVAEWGNIKPDFR